MRAGQVRGLEALLRDHGSRVKGILGVTFRRPEGDHALEDAVCNASLGMWKRARKLDPGGNLGGYFYVAARRELVRILFFEQPPMSYKDVARHFGLAVGSLGFIRGRCLKKLQQALRASGVSGA